MPGISFRTDNEPFKVCFRSVASSRFRYFLLAAWLDLVKIDEFPFFWNCEDCNEGIHSKDCRDDESGKAVPDTRRTDHLVTSTEAFHFKDELGFQLELFSFPAS